MNTRYSFEVYLVKFEHSVGAEIRGTRPAVILFPKKIGKKTRTAFVAPMTTGGRGVGKSMKVKTRFNGRDGYVLFNHMDSVDKSRIIKYLGKISDDEAEQIADAFTAYMNKVLSKR